MHATFTIFPRTNQENIALIVMHRESGSHFGHKILKIYRHGYKDVVLLSEMENLIDCSQIQERVNFKDLDHGILGNNKQERRFHC